jgi:pimeloyl-ACP methyl ester carboxylesterase
MSATQRPVTEITLPAGLTTDAPAWRSIPSWFVFSDNDLNIPVALHRFMADRADAKGTREVPGASYALSVSQPEAVTASILEARGRTRGRGLTRSSGEVPGSGTGDLTQQKWPYTNEPR